MANEPEGRAPSVAKVDFMVDEKGSKIDLPDGSDLRPTGDIEAAMGSASGPSMWWLYGVIGLAIVIALLFAMQMLNGAPGTDVEPGTPTAAPVTEAPAN